MSEGFNPLSTENIKTPDGIGELNRMLQVLFDNTVGNTANVKPYSGYGSPEGVITASVGSVYLRLDGGNNYTLYIKESGDGDTGWRSTTTTDIGEGSFSFKTIATPSGTSPVADSPTDTLNLIAGDGISITGDSTTDSVTIENTGSAANSFETMSTPSGTSPVADSSSDTLTFLEGDNILITGDSSADSITIGVDLLVGASRGMIYYVDQDVFGTLYIRKLPIGLNTQVLTTDGVTPFWDYVYNTPGGQGNNSYTKIIRIFSDHAEDLIAMNNERDFTISLTTTNNQTVTNQNILPSTSVVGDIITMDKTSDNTISVLLTNGVSVV